MSMNDRIIAEILAELRPWDATYDIEGIVLELRDSYPELVYGASLESIPESERWDVYRTYDRAVI